MMTPGIYVLSSVDAFLKQPCRNIAQGLIITGDGEIIDLKPYQGIILLNIANWGGGLDAWGSEGGEKVWGWSATPPFLFQCYYSFKLSGSTVDAVDVSSKSSSLY